MLSEEKNNQGIITISDVAEALNISKTTVSRAISGKGRIGAQTRERVLRYIDEHNYKPNPIAKGLANSRTYNICWVMPADYVASDLPFFQRCLVGISEISLKEDYDILTTFAYSDNASPLIRIVTNRKVDGVILSRTLTNDPNIRLLKEHSLPFVVIGSTEEDDVVQIDNDHIRACCELTSILAMKGVRRMALIGGSMRHVVNQTRYKGFQKGLSEQGIREDKRLVRLDLEDEKAIERATDDVLSLGAECIICMDDGICRSVLGKLKRDEIDIPGRVKLASFYNSMLLENNQPAITALSYDPKELGGVAAKTLFSIIRGENVEGKVLLGYDVLLKASTQ